MDSSHRVLSDEYPCARDSVIYFLHHFVLAKLAITGRSYLAAKMTGTTSMMSRVSLGLTPNDVIPAYDNALITPDAPVPEDHVETVFLENIHYIL